MRSASENALFVDFESQQYRSMDQPYAAVPTDGGQNPFGIKIEVIEATDLSTDVNPYCCAWLFMMSDDQISATETVSMNTLENLLTYVENAPQVRTRAIQSTDPVWRQSFTLTEAVLHSRDTGRKRFAPLVGKPVMLVISVNNTSGVFGMEETIGRAYVKDLRPGEAINQWCLLQKSDQQQVLSCTGRPSAIHLKVEYAKQMRKLSWTEATSESNLSLASALSTGLSSAIYNGDVGRIGTSSSFSPVRRGPFVVSHPQKSNQRPLLAEPPIDLLLQSKAAMTLHQQNLVLAKDISRKDSLAALLPFTYENQDWHIVEGFSSRDKPVLVGPNRTNKPIVIRSCKGDNSKIAFTVQGLTDMLVVENCSNLKVMVSRVSKDIIISGCKDLELVVGGSAPHVTVVASKQCTIMVCKDMWNTNIQSIGCTGIFVHTAHSNGILDLEPQSLVNAPTVERILLPDILLTQVNAGTITTQCHFSEQIAPARLDVLPDSSVYSSNSRSVQAREDRERSPSALYSSQTIPDRCGVGMLLRKCENGFKVEKVARGGPAWKDGLIQEGDVLVAVHGVRTKGKSTREVSNELAGAENSKVLLTITRYSLSGAFKTFDVTLKRGPLNDENYFVTDRSPSSQPLIIPQPPSEQSNKFLMREFSPAERLGTANEIFRSFPPREPRSVVGVGLGVRPNADGSYRVSGIVPMSSADTCSKIRVGDVLHSVDGVPVCGKPYEAVRDLVQGPVGTQVMIAFLRPEASPENLYQGLNEFEAWRPVVLTRGLSSSSSPLSQTGDQFTPPQRGKANVGREPVAVALWLNEDYDAIAGDAERKASFSAQLAEDLAMALQTSPRRIIVVDLLKGVVADVNLMPDYLDDARSPEILAREIASMASDPMSKLRTARTTCRALRAEVRGPVSQVRPLREVFSPNVKPLHLLEDRRVIARQRSLSRDDSQQQNGSQALLEWQSELQKKEAERKRIELENQETMRKIQEQEELRRRAEEHERTRRLAEEERFRREAEELEAKRRQLAEQERLLKLAEEQERFRKQLEEQERMVKLAEENERLRKLAEEQERLQKEVDERDRRRRIEAEELELRRRESLDQERRLKLEQEERDRRQRLDEEERERRKRMDEEEFLRRKRMDEEEQLRKKKLEEEIQQRVKREEEERLRQEAEEKRVKEAEEKESREAEEQRLRDMEEKKMKELQEQEIAKSAEQEELDRRKEQEASRQRDEDSKTERTQRRPSTENMTLNIPQISPIQSFNADRRSSNFSVTPRMSSDAVRKVILTRAPNQGRKVNPGDDVGVGISFQAARPTNQIVIVSIAPGGSAETSGNVSVGDIIHRIDNTSVQGKRIPEIVALIKGRPGTNVVLEVQASDIQPPSTLHSNAGSLYSSGNYSTQGANYDIEKTSGIHATRSVTDPSLRTIVLTRQVNSQPGTPPVGPDELVGVGLGFVINDGVHIISGLARGGSAETSGLVHIGDRIVAVENIPTTGKDVDTVVNLIKGRRGTPVRLTLQNPQNNEGTLATSARQPGPPPRLGGSSLSPPPLNAATASMNRMVPTAAVPPKTLSSRFSETPRQEQIVMEPQYNLHMIVKRASGIVPVDERPPAAVCNIRLLYPDASPTSFNSIYPLAPSPEPEFGNKSMILPIPASRLKNVQLELTLWDEVFKEKSFMGEVVINISKLSDPDSTLGRPIEHNFVFKQGGTYVPQRPISGSILLELQLMPPS